MSSAEALLLCRVCANPSDDSAMFPLFDDADGPLALAEIFLQVSGITILAGDLKLPKSCCQRCKNRLQEVEDLRALCQESDRKLRKMIGTEVKEEDIVEQNGNDVDTIPKVELLEMDESYSQWDDTGNQLDSDDGRSDSSDDDKPLKSRQTKRLKTDIALIVVPENGEEHCFSDDSRDDDPDFLAKETPKRVGRKKKEEVINTEPKIPKKRGRKPKIRDPALEAQPKVLKKRGPKPKIRDPNANPEEEKERKKKEKVQQESLCCMACGKVYKSLFALREHETSHSNEKRFKCEICLLEFARRNNYKMHLKRHETEGQFKCNECEKAFHLEKLLKQHIQIRHRGERPFACKFCPKTYPRASSLFMHVRTIHEGIKKKTMKCDICMRQFVCKYGYERHMNSHKGIKLNQCPHCGNKYEFKAYVLQHIAEKHPETVPNLTRCQYCGLGYSSDGYYRKHIVKRHREHLQEFDVWMKAKREAMMFPGKQSIPVEPVASSEPEPPSGQDTAESFPDKNSIN